MSAFVFLVFSFLFSLFYETQKSLFSPFSFFLSSSSGEPSRWNSSLRIDEQNQTWSVLFFFPSSFILLDDFVFHCFASYPDSFATVTGSVKVPGPTKVTFKMMNNAELFIAAIKEYGVSRPFLSAELVNNTNMMNVVASIHELAQIVPLPLLPSSSSFFFFFCLNDGFFCLFL
jgi:hypothetical protein